jgi:hypothetical protein
MTKYYSIEIYFPYKDIIQEDIEIKSTEANIQLKKIAKKFKGDFFAFDEDIGFNPTTGETNRLGFNYNWIFYSFDKIKLFIQELPKQYTIKWIYNNDKSDSESIYIIYSIYKKPEIIKFNSDDKELYRIILNKLKNN